jgi:hypothetical protein
MLLLLLVVKGNNPPITGVYDPPRWQDWLVGYWLLFLAALFALLFGNRIRTHIFTIYLLTISRHIPSEAAHETHKDNRQLSLSR